MVEFKAIIISSQEKLFQLLNDIPIKCEPVEDDEDNYHETDDVNITGLKIESVVSIKEEMFGDGEGYLENSSRDEEIVHSEKEDRNNCGPDSEDLIKLRRKKRKPKQPPVKEEADSEEEARKRTLRRKKRKGKIPSKSSRLDDPRFENILRDLDVLECQECSTKFSSFSQLRSHISRAHYKKLYITCCGYSFTGPKEVHSHMEYHLDEDAFKCAECGERLLSSIKLRIHKVMHRTPRFECKLCGKAFTGVNKLDRHLMYHKEPPHKCPKCAKGT